MKQTAEIVLDSVINGERFTTMRYEIWRPLHSEMLSYRSGVARNASSSRAVPFHINLKRVSEDPFVPSYFGAEHKGMMPSEYLVGDELLSAQEVWRMGAKVACAAAESLSSFGVSKSICNRMLEPYNTINVLMTGNVKFWAWMFKQRCSKARGGQGDAEPNLSELCDLMKGLYDASEPVESDVHMPYFTRDLRGFALERQMMICSARCARLSYCQHGNPKMDAEVDVELAKRLIESGHLSPLEHMIMGYNEGYGMLAGFDNYGGNALSTHAFTFREVIEVKKTS
jgi:hypothetical protein